MASKTKYQVLSPISMGEKDDDGNVTIRDLQPGATISLTEDEAYAIRHALRDAPTMPSKIGAVRGEDGEWEGGRDFEEEEEAAIESIRKRPDNEASGVLLHWKTDAVAVAAAERRAADAADSATPSKRGAAGEAADNTEALEHGFQRSSAGPGSTTDPGGFSGRPERRPSANMTEMEKEDLPKIRQQEADDLKKRREQAKAMSSGAATRKPVEGAKKPSAGGPPAGGSPAAQTK